MKKYVFTFLFFLFGYLASTRVRSLIAAPERPYLWRIHLLPAFLSGTGAVIISCFGDRMSKYVFTFLLISFSILAFTGGNYLPAAQERACLWWLHLPPALPAGATVAAVFYLQDKGMEKKRRG